MDAYMATLRWSLRYDRPTDGVRRGIVRRFFGRFRDHRLWVIGIGVGAFMLTIAMFAIIPKTFQPPQDNDRAVAKIEMVPGTTLAQTDLVVKRVAAFLSKQPDVESVYARTGSAMAVSSRR